MSCAYQNICGGCPLRELNAEDYRRRKIERFQKIAANLKQDEIPFGEPVFIADGQRRRAEFTFQYRKGTISLGFNAAQSHQLVDIATCAALTQNLNNVLPRVRDFLQKLCAIKSTQKIKTKFVTSNINQGEIWLTEAANGIDILLEIDENITLEHRMEICDFLQ